MMIKISSGFKSRNDVNLSSVWAPPPVRLVALRTMLTLELIVVGAHCGLNNATTL